MPKEIVYDIETQNTLPDGTKWDHRLFKISVVGVYFFETNEYKVYMEHELPELFQRFEHADRIIGFNQIGFDNPVMNNYYAGDVNMFPNLDILVEIQKALGFRLKLDHVASATLGYGKTGHGLQAVEFWKQGKIEELKAYCLQDVKVTKEIYEYGLKHGALAYHDLMGERKRIPVDFELKKREHSAINLTMPI